MYTRFLAKVLVHTRKRAVLLASLRRFLVIPCFAGGRLGSALAAELEGSVADAAFRFNSCAFFASATQKIEKSSTPFPAKAASFRSIEWGAKFAA